MITNHLSPPRNYATPVTNAKYKQADRLKICKKEFHIMTESAFSSGQLSAVEAILNAHREDPYTDVDTMIGDMHLLIVHTWNHFRSLHAGKAMPLTLEKVMEDQGLLGTSVEKQKQELL